MNITNKVSVTRKLTDIFSHIFSFVLFGLLFLFISVLIAFNDFSPGTILQLQNLVLLIIVPFLLAHLVSLSTSKRGMKPKDVKQISKKAKILLCVVVVMLFASLMTTYAMQKHDVGVKLKAAKERFTVTIVETIPVGKINSTLIELESQFERLYKVFKPKNNVQEIKVELYPNVEILQEMNKIPYSFDAYITYDKDGIPVIKLPVEDVGNGAYQSNQ